jgi:quercetin dioxygenase-like cupin family protein
MDFYKSGKEEVILPSWPGHCGGCPSWFPTEDVAIFIHRCSFLFKPILKRMAKVGQIIDLGASGVRIVITKSAKDTNGSLAQMESTMQAGKKLPALPHIHPTMEEKLEVLSGELTTLIAGKRLTVKTGEHIVIPPGALHNFWNESASEVRVRIEHRPAMNIQNFLETLGGLVKDGKIKYDGSFSDKLQMAVVVNAYRPMMMLPSPQHFLIGIISRIGRLLGRKGNHPEYFSD